MTEELIYSTENILNIIKDVPDYQTFYTVDELKASTYQLAKKYPNRVAILSIGHSRQGDSYDSDVVGAKAAGLISCWLSPKPSITNNVVVKADFVISRLKELGEML
jgi:hypothetical protein